MAGQHRLDLVVLVGLKATPVQIQRYALTPIHIVIHHVQVEAVAHVDPKTGKLAKGRGQNCVARGQAIADRRFPAAGARSGEQKDVTCFGAENALQVIQQRLGEVRKVRGAVVFQRNIHRLANFEWHIGRPWYGQCLVSNHSVLRLSPHWQRMLSHPSAEFTRISVVVFFVILTRVFFVKL